MHTRTRTHTHISLSGCANAFLHRAHTYYTHAKITHIQKSSIDTHTLYTQPHKRTKVYAYIRINIVEHLKAHITQDI